MFGGKWIALAVAGVLAVGCSKQESDAGDKGSKLSPAGKAALAKIEAKQKVPAELSADGITVGAATVTRKPALTGNGQELEIAAMLTNQSKGPVEGVNLSITFEDADGIVVGGHSTQQYFQPALAVGAKQGLVVRAPVIGGADNRAAKASVLVLNQIKGGGSPDGWKPLDPNHMPEPKVVPGSEVSLTQDGRRVEPVAVSVPAPASE